MSAQITAQTIRRTATNRIRKMPPSQAMEILSDMEAIIKVNASARSTVARIITRCMTGGYWSQSLDGHVHRELGLHAMKSK